ncbi:MAG: dihydroorotate dehydrogenase electron transfer subunit [Gammaproteobacteria bacterium]|nr:dihydroorotate dehydrogenase electron transfer subunit [Gammaproteobacteria bacterium]
MSKLNRGTICVEDAEVLEHRAYADDQYVLRLLAPDCAARAIAGSFAHVRCSDDIPMRRPLSIMRARADEGWIEVLYKVVGHGLQRLAEAQPGDRISMLGPIGNGFTVDKQRTTALMIGGGVGIPPLIFLAEQIAATNAPVNAVAMLGSEIPFPFELVDSQIALDGSPASATASLECLERIGTPSRLATNAGYPGCYAGFVTDLSRGWLQSLPEEERATVQVYSCGPGPMLYAVEKLASEFGLPTQLCLEEYMACAVGGCAGCAVEIHTPDGPAMKRVCVDGPVFAGDTVYPELA